MIRSIIAAIILIILNCSSVLVQSSPGLVYKQVPTAAQWNQYFSNKMDYTGSAACLVTGCAFSGEITTAVPTTSSSGFNLPPGTAPTTPNNGDCWTTNSGLFCQINGATIGPFVSAATGPFLPLAGGTMTGTITGSDAGTWG